MNWDYGVLQRCRGRSQERVSRRECGFTAQFSIAQAHDRCQRLEIYLPSKILRGAGRLLGLRRHTIDHGSMRSQRDLQSGGVAEVLRIP
jgi:hypothetical protein